MQTAQGHRLCVWVEQHGNGVTLYDLKVRRVYPDMTRMLVVVNPS